MERYEARFRETIENQVRRPLHEALGRYGDALHEIVGRMGQVASPQDQDDGGARREGARARLEYAERFAAAFARDIMEPADRERADFFRRLSAVEAVSAGLPEEVHAGPAPADAPRPHAFLRPGPWRRLTLAVRRPSERSIPVAAIGRAYLARLAIRLEPAVSHAATLDSVALAAIRRRFQTNAEASKGAADGLPSPEPGSAALDATLTKVVREIDAAVREVTEGFSRALDAPAVRVNGEDVRRTLERANQRNERILRDWESFEDALRENTAAEAAMARAVASMEAAAARAARELDEVLDRHARGPLDHMSHRLAALATETGPGIRERSLDAVPPIRSEAARLFEDEMPAVTRALQEELTGVTGAFIEALDRIPGDVPDDLQISDEPIHSVPDRPERLEVRDAPLAELLSTACRGTLPRWAERAMETTAAELAALEQELIRARNAVDFHIRAPLQGRFSDDEAAELIVGIMERTASHLEELRDSGLEAVDRVIMDLERRTAEEAETVRKAVADREFLRIRSEIAEEQAVRGISAGMRWTRELVGSGLRLSRRGWSAGHRGYAVTRDWAERRLGVGDVEREEMLESLEESLLGEERDRIVLPGLYRQLFDVEADVPWEELLVARDDELAALERALRRWRRGHAAAVAIVGEKGSGKTTLLRMAARGPLSGETVRTVELESTVQGPDDLAERVGRSLEIDADDWSDLPSAIRARDPFVVVVENAHHLFIRALGGFTAMESLLELVAATRREACWVLTMDEHAWRYMDNVMGVAAHFTQVVNTTNLSPEQLERAVMARHEVSGFSLRYELDAETNGGASWWRRFLKKEPQGQLTRRELDRRRFFGELNQVVEGNIFLALFHWLRSIDRVEDHVLVLRSPETIDLSFLERLPLPSLHTVAAIVLHGGLSEVEHQRIFQLDAAESRLHLATLADAHLIFRSDDDEYRINKVLYRPLVRLLRTKNIL